MIKAVFATCILIFGAVSVPVFAQSGPLQLEGTAGSKSTISTYSDSEGREKTGKLAVGELTFPVRVFEETPTGMVRIRHNGAEYWVAGEDFRIRRAVQANCNITMVRVNTGADRGANEGCVVPAKK